MAKRLSKNNFLVNLQNAIQHRLECENQLYPNINIEYKNSSHIKDNFVEEYNAFIEELKNKALNEPPIYIPEHKESEEKTENKTEPVSEEPVSQIIENESQNVDVNIVSESENLKKSKSKKRKNNSTTINLEESQILNEM